MSIIAYTADHSKPLYNQEATRAYLLKIYIKVCADVELELKKAKEFTAQHPPPGPGANIEESPGAKDKNQLKIIILYLLILTLIFYIIILS